jgi:DNA-binding NarL/FixJ family response regulator
VPQADPASPRVLIVDDHDLFRSGLRMLLEDEGYQAADVSGGEEALRRIPAQRPDVVLMDINMPGMSGIEATRRITERWPGLPVVMLTVAVDDEHVLDAVRAGARGYLLKDAELEEIDAGIRAAQAGHGVMASAVTGGVLDRLRAVEGPEASAPARTSPLDVLTSREREVLRLIATGAENGSIAERLFMSHGTVKAHVSSILDKLGVENRVQAAVLAIRESPDG